MSDYEKINTKVKEQMSARRIEAFKMIAIVMAVLGVTLGALIGLNAISSTFMVILASIATCTAAFKAGRISRDIKF